MFKLGLSWKVSIVVTTIIILVMAAVGLLVYNSTGEIVREQVDNQIALMNDQQWRAIEDTFESLENELRDIAQDSNIYSLADVTNNQSADDLDSYLTRQIVRTTGSRLDREVENRSSLAFAYLTTPGGVTTADSRHKEADIMDFWAEETTDDADDTEYVGLRLSVEQYSQVPLGQFTEIDGERLILHSVPIQRRQSEDIIGYLVAGVDIAALFEGLSTELGEYGAITLLNNDGIILNHSDPQLVGTRTDVDWYISQIGQVHEVVEEIREDNYRSLTPLADGQLFLAADISIERITEPALAIGRHIIQVFSIAVIAIFLVVSAFVSWQLKPLRLFVKAFEQMEAGELNNSELSNSRLERRRDEIGSLVRAFNSMADNLRSIVQGISRSTEETSRTTQELSSSTEETSASVQQVAAKASSLSNSASEIDSSIAELASAVEDLRDSAKHITDVASQVNGLAQDGLTDMQSTQREMSDLLNPDKEAKGSVVNLNKATNEINSIVEVIYKIAEQTNLLALNAAIEAARAGEHGRSFAVVASEISELAEQTRTSTENITGIISRLTAQTQQTTSKIEAGVASVNQSEKTFSEIVSFIDDLVSRIQDTANAVDRLSGSTDQIKEISKQQSVDSEEISAATQQQAAIMAEIANSVQQLATMAGDLEQSIQHFKP